MVKPNGFASEKSFTILRITRSSNLAKNFAIVGTSPELWQTTSAMPVSRETCLLLKTARTVSNFQLYDITVIAFNMGKKYNPHLAFSLCIEN